MKVLVVGTGAREHAKSLSLNKVMREKLKK